MSLVFQEDSKQNSNSQSAEKLFLTTNEDDDMYILTSAAFKASFSESFLLLFFILIFLIFFYERFTKKVCDSWFNCFRALVERTFTILDSPFTWVHLGFFSCRLLLCRWLGYLHHQQEGYQKIQRK